jgi:hypothetical protein
MNRIDLIVLSPANHFRVFQTSHQASLMATIHNNLPRLRLAATKIQERRKDADDSELSHNDSTKQLNRMVREGPTLLFGSTHNSKDREH